MFLVFHNGKTDFHQARVQDPQALIPVALVLADTVDQAYQMTINRDKPWWLNQNLIAANESHRSTAVGDVILNLKTQAAHIVGQDDWVEAPESLAQRLMDMASRLRVHLISPPQEQQEAQP